MALDWSSLASGVQGAGVFMSAFGAQDKANTQKATLGYESAVALNNQKLANYQADVALENGVLAEQNQRLKTAALKGDQRAAMAASGVDLGEGSANEILTTTKFMGERDALTIRDNAARQAWALREQGKGYASEAAANSALSDAINPDMSFASTLLTSGSQVAGSWYSYNKAKS